MKKLLILASVAMLIAGCSSNEDKAKSLIKDYLSKTMKDPSSYEEVESSKLDSAFSKFIQSDEYNRLFEKKLSLQSARDSIIVHSAGQDKEDSINSALSDVEKEIEAGEKNFKSEFFGWKMKHSFRGKNSFGAKEVATEIFFFDPELTKVINVINLSD